MYIEDRCEYTKSNFRNSNGSHDPSETCANKCVSLSRAGTASWAGTASGDTKFRTKKQLENGSELT